MGKDPAFLFYPGDWMGGTMTFSRSHKGAYMDLLMCQFNHGHMALQDVKVVLGSDFDEMWEPKLKVKFEIDANGRFFNEKLEKEVFKRRAFTLSRKKNLSHMVSHMDSHMDKHMENGNGNRNIIKDVNRNRGKESQREKEIKEVFEFWKVELNHPKSILDEKRRKAIMARLLEGYSVERIKEAIVGIQRSPHNMGANDEGKIFDDIELICRSGANVDRFADTRQGETKETVKAKNKIKSYLIGDYSNDQK